MSKNLPQLIVPTIQQNTLNLKNIGIIIAETDTIIEITTVIGKQLDFMKNIESSCFELLEVYHNNSKENIDMLIF